MSSNLDIVNRLMHEALHEAYQDNRVPENFDGNLMSNELMRVTITCVEELDRDTKTLSELREYIKESINTKLEEITP